MLLFSVFFLSVDRYLEVFAQTLEENIVFCFLKGVCCPFAAIAVTPILLLGVTEPDPKHQGPMQLVTVTTSLSPVSLSVSSFPHFVAPVFCLSSCSFCQSCPSACPCYSSVCLLSAAVCLFLSSSSVRPCQIRRRRF